MVAPLNQLNTEWKYHQTHAKTQVVGTPSSDFAVGGDGWETKSGKKGTSASLPIGKSFNNNFKRKKKRRGFPGFPDFVQWKSSNDAQLQHTAPTPKASKIPPFPTILGAFLIWHDWWFIRQNVLTHVVLTWEVKGVTPGQSLTQGFWEIQKMPARGLPWQQMISVMFPSLTCVLDSSVEKTFAPNPGLWDKKNRSKLGLPAKCPRTTEEKDHTQDIPHAGKYHALPNLYQFCVLQ